MNKKIILSLLLICAVLTPFFVKAITVDELKAKIADLQAQINQLITQLTQLQGNGTTAWCHNFNTNLGIGSIGAEVSALHSALSKEVIIGDLGWSSDTYDEETASFVVAFQQKYKSEILTPWRLKYATGYVGKSTRAKLNKLYGCGNIALQPIATTTAPTTTTTIPVSNICTMDAKQCPDGSYVSRSGPNCAFAVCPIISPPPTPPLENFTYNLQKGWNAISLPIQPADPSLKTFLGQLSSATNYRFYAYDSVSQNYKIVAVKSSAENYINDLTLDINQNYTLYIEQPVSITIQGSVINKSIEDWVKSIRENAYKYLIGNTGERKSMFLTGFPFLSSITPKAINDIVAQTAPYSSLGWLKYNAGGGWQILHYPLSTSTSTESMYRPLEPGKGYFGTEVIDCQKKYGAGYFCGNSADLANKCNGKGTSYLVSDTNPAAFCGPNVTSLNDNQYYCLKCSDYQAVKIGNPGLAQFPNMDSGDRYARGVKDLQLYQGKIYVGTGDGINNRGPINVWSFIPSDSPIFENEYSIDDESVDRFRVYSDKLYIPGADATESWDFGNFYYKENGVWTKKRTIPGAVHVMDIAEVNGKLCVADGGQCRDGHSCGGHLLISSDGGNSWTISNHQYDTPNYFNTIWNIIPWKDKFLSFFAAYKTPEISFITLGLLQSDDNNNFSLTGVSFMPMEIFGDKIFGYCGDKKQYCFSSDLKTFSYIDQLYHGFNLIDQVVVGDSIYLLVKENPSPDYKYYTGSVYSSKDLLQWTKEFSFDFPAMPNRIEFLNDAFYIGLESNYVATTQTYIDDEAGSIYKISR